MKGLEEARILYIEQGKELIGNLFPEYENKIAVGLAGRGSECFGFDDELSRDHDFERGFCLWVDDDTDREIGFRLNRAYRELCGKKQTERSAHGSSPTGLWRISDFYRRYIGSPSAPDSWQQWMYLPSNALAEASNGQVWRDDQGIFTAEREMLLHGMPEDVRLKKLAAGLALMAQSGQYNYSRCLAHGEQGAAMLAMSEFVRAAAAVVYLVNRVHMPYYKWMLKGMERLEKLSQLSTALEFLLCGENDASGRKLKAGVVEDVCAQLSAQLYAEGICCGKWDYLERQAEDIMGHIQTDEIRAMHIMEGLF